MSSNIPDRCHHCHHFRADDRICENYGRELPSQCDDFITPADQRIADLQFIACSMATAPDPKSAILTFLRQRLELMTKYCNGRGTRNDELEYIIQVIETHTLDDHFWNFLPRKR